MSRRLSDLWIFNPQNPFWGLKIPINRAPLAVCKVKIADSCDFYY